jgi:transposase
MKRNKRYTEEFKQQAVDMLNSSHKSAAQIAKDLGCSASTLLEWKKRSGQTFKTMEKPHKATAQELEAENKRLKKELALVTEQREILKKAAAILGH